LTKITETLKYGLKQWM